MPRTERKASAKADDPPRKSARKSDPPVRLGFDEQQDDEQGRQSKALQDIELPYEVAGNVPTIEVLVDQYNRLLKFVQPDKASKWQVGKIDHDMRESVRTIEFAIRQLHEQRSIIDGHKHKLEKCVKSSKYWYANGDVLGKCASFIRSSGLH